MTNNITILLRPLKLDDINDRYASWYANTDGHLDYYTTSGRSFSKDWLQEEFKYSKKNNKHFHAIIDSATGLVIGNVRIGAINLKHKTSDLVTFIGDRNYLGKGLAPIIIKQASDIAFKDHDIRKLSGGMIEGNIPSLKSYLRADWLIEGILRQHHLVNDKPQDFINVAYFNPAYFNKDFMDKVKKNHDSWYNNIFKV